jgi:hypothetical protein
MVRVVPGPRGHRQHLLARESALVLEGHMDQERQAMPAQYMATAMATAVSGWQSWQWALVFMTITGCQTLAPYLHAAGLLA